MKTEQMHYLIAFKKRLCAYMVQTESAFSSAKAYIKYGPDFCRAAI
jgi:hypothetical protein